MPLRRSKHQPCGVNWDNGVCVAHFVKLSGSRKYQSIFLKHWSSSNCHDLASITNTSHRHTASIWYCNGWTGCGLVMPGNEFKLSEWYWCLKELPCCKTPHFNIVVEAIQDIQFGHIVRMNLHNLTLWYKSPYRKLDGKEKCNDMPSCGARWNHYPGMEWEGGIYQSTHVVDNVYVQAYEDLAVNPLRLWQM